MKLRPLIPALAVLALMTSAAAVRAEPAASKGGDVQSFGDTVDTADSKSAPKSKSKKAAASDDAAAADVAGASDGDAPPPKPKPKPKRRKPKPKPKPPELPPGYAQSANGMAPVGGSAPPPLMAGATSIAQISAPTVGPARAFSPLEAAQALAPLYATLTDFRPLDAENTLIIDTERGRIIIELRPEFAPLAVARVKKLARRGVYNGLLFHRVIETFVAQTGNPNNKDGGKSDEPNLPPEFNFRLGADIPRTVVARPQGETEGFIGASPYASVDETRMAMSPDHRVTGWGAFCPGVVGMGRDAAPDSANSEIFLMREATRRLDRDYAVVGKVVAGLEVVRALTVGEPPVHPDKMVRVSVMSDLPDNERPKVRVLNTLSPQFTALADRIRALRGADFSICDIEVPTRAY